MNSVIKLSSTDSRLFSAEIASVLGDINAAVIVQQLHYWMGKEGVGTIIGGVKYIYNSFNDWVKQFPWLSVWQFRKAMTKLRFLGIVKVIRHKSRQWNQTNYYTLNSDRLFQILNPKTPKTPETSEMCVSTDRDEDTPQIEVSSFNISYIDTKKTIQKETAKNKEVNIERSLSSNQIAAVSIQNALKQKNEQENTLQVELNGLASQSKAKSEDNQTVTKEQKSSSICSIKEIKKINKDWKKQIEQLDSLGVQVNKTLISLVKMYSESEVERAIALLKIRKREKFIPNLAGYFTAALKGGWASTNLVTEEPEAVNKASVFRLWYDLAKELGYCSSQEIREGEQWVSISGSWEKWEDATKRGYSLEYLKGVIKRNKNG